MGIWSLPTFPSSIPCSLTTMACFLHLQHTQPFPASGPLHSLSPTWNALPPCPPLSGLLSFFRCLGKYLSKMTSLFPHLHSISTTSPYFISLHISLFSTIDIFLPLSPWLECRLHKGMCACYVTSVLSDPVQPHGLWPTGSSVHRILQARILEWVATPSSRGSSWPRDWTCVSYDSRTAGRFFITEPPGKPTYCPREWEIKIVTLKPVL